MSLKKKFTILPSLFLHLLGLLVAFFQRKNQLPFHLLRFFSWWSVHASLLAIFALMALLWEEKKQKTT